MPLVTQTVELSVGAVVAPDTFGRVRLRQLYEQRRIELAEPEKHMRVRKVLGQTAEQVAAAASVASAAVSIPDVDMEEVSETSDAVLDSPPIPVVEESVNSVEKSTPQSSRSDKRTYKPAKGVVKP